MVDARREAEALRTEAASIRDREASRVATLEAEVSDLQTKLSLLRSKVVESEAALSAKALETGAKDEQIRARDQGQGVHQNRHGCAARGSREVFSREHPRGRTSRERYVLYSGGKTELGGPDSDAIVPLESTADLERRTSVLDPGDRSQTH